MKIVSNNTEANKTKKFMDLLLACSKDKTLTVKERNQYYSDYLQLSANYIILSR
jgi:hypothetical protein